MSEKLSLPMMTIRHRGFFSQPDLLKVIQGWLMSDGWFPNVIFKEKAATLGKDFYILINAGKKMSEYVKFDLEVLIKIYGLREVELIKDGKKIKTGEGHVQIELVPTIELDWQNRFNGNKFLQALHDLLRNHILKYKISDYWEDMMIMNMEDLARKIRDSLGQEV